MSSQLKTAPAKPATAFGLKGNLLTLTVMHLFQTDLDAIRQQLQTTIASSPKFFAQMPIVIDLQHLAEHPYPIDYSGISALLREQGLIPVGISNGTEAQRTAAGLAGLGTLSQIKKEVPTPPEKVTTRKTAHDTRARTAAKDASNSEQASATQTKLITSPIRSGQQVYAKGDLIIVTTVSAGAEVLADGNIHIYGPLRGRALAGVQGDTSARIFCHGLQAELISIAGYYKLHENIKVTSPTAPVQIFIQDDQLEIALL